LPWCAPRLLLGLNPRRLGWTPWSIFSAQNPDFLVNFQRAATSYVSKLSSGIARLLLANLDEDLRPPTQPQVARAAQLAVEYRVSLPHEALMDRMALQDFIDTLARPS